MLLRVEGARFCHSDVHIMDGDLKVLTRIPVTLGHENAGRVATVGAGVRTVKEGDPVALYGVWGDGMPARLHLMIALREGERTVGSLVEATGFGIANVSKHLQLLRPRASSRGARRVSASITRSLAMMSSACATSCVGGSRLRREHGGGFFWPLMRDRAIETSWMRSAVDDAIEDDSKEDPMDTSTIQTTVDANVSLSRVGNEELARSQPRSRRALKQVLDALTD